MKRRNLEYAWAPLLDRRLDESFTVGGVVVFDTRLVEVRTHLTDMIDDDIRCCRETRHVRPPLSAANYDHLAEVGRTLADTGIDCGCYPPLRSVICQHARESFGILRLNCKMSLRRQQEPTSARFPSPSAALLMKPRPHPRSHLRPIWGDRLRQPIQPHRQFGTDTSCSDQVRQVIDLLSG